jgi:lipoprotein NlpI
MKLSLALPCVIGTMLIAATPAYANWTADAVQCADEGLDAKNNVDACTRALDSGKLDPIEKARTYHNRGLLRAILKDYPNAILDLTEAIKIEPDKPEHFFTRGEISMQRRQFPQAIADFQNGLRLDGPSVRGYYLLGLAQTGNNERDKAIDDYSKALNIAPREIAVLNERANAYFTSRDWDRALADYTAAIAIQPKNPILYHNRGEVWRITNDLRHAQTDFDRAISLDPKYESAYIRRGFVRIAQRNFKDALSDFDMAVSISPSPSNLSQRGIARFYYARYRDAEGDLDASVKGLPTNAYGVLWLYLSRLHQGNDDITALRDQSKALNLANFPGPIVRFYLGEIKADDVMAIVKTGTAQQQREQLCEASFYLGEEALLRGNRDQAVSLFRQSIGTGLTYFYEYQGSAIEMQHLGL